ncbi:hypothetical protein CVU82_01635 [Candidatus Falkowbacteria bacterium HGW-Falkowbacteria-1]|jgi:putative flippase GtrA|uniref:GtrA/DPMS transmembrane domain-containing protein n=1 Tax=Candidatus Falkowbacteria bacterium HGW-Falkowbacteria-1 TaxID=2013768 RepID=A0A2N2E9D1_9BACT|nr:MAG: hypothetical protein CVU82_01635 [Candidatus Falkowbacteria bacterium HGW-Falkowbacteria-1]
MYQKLKFLVFSYFPITFKILKLGKVYVKFFVTGFFTLILDLIFLFLFYDIFDCDILVSTAIAFILSFVFNFFVHKFWTFRNDNLKYIYKQILYYMFIALLNLGINIKLMHIFVNNMDFNYLLSQIATTILIGIESFFVYNFVIFNKNKGCKN